MMMPSIHRPSRPSWSPGEAGDGESQGRALLFSPLPPLRPAPMYQYFFPSRMVSLCFFKKRKFPAWPSHEGDPESFFSPSCDSNYYVTCPKKKRTHVPTVQRLPGLVLICNHKNFFFSLDLLFLYKFFK